MTVIFLLVIINYKQMTGLKKEDINTVVDPESTTAIVLELVDGVEKLAKTKPSKSFIYRQNLVKKLFTSFGDSITEQEEWQPSIVELYNLTHTNCGIGSSSLAGDRETAFWKAVRLDAVKASNPDVLTILGGANDIVYNVLIGTDAEFLAKDTDTFKGAYAYIIENLLTWKPTLKIILMSTTWAHEDGESLTSVTSGLTYTDYANATKEVAAYYGLPCADLHGECGFNTLTSDIFLKDGIHPNSTGALKIVEVLTSYFDRLQF